MNHEAVMDYSGSKFLKPKCNSPVEIIGRIKSYLFPQIDPTEQDVFEDWTSGDPAKQTAQTKEAKKPSILLESFQDVLDVSRRAKSITIELAILHDPETAMRREGTQYTIDDGSVRYTLREAYVCDPNNPSISALLKRDDRVKTLRKNSADGVEVIYEEDKTPDTAWERIYAEHHRKNIHMAEIIQPVQTQEVFPLKAVKRLLKTTAIPV